MTPICSNCDGELAGRAIQPRSTDVEDASSRDDEWRASSQSAICASPDGIGFYRACAITIRGGAARDATSLALYEPNLKSSLQIGTVAL
jgi:hypothetical protein